MGTIFKVLAHPRAACRVASEVLGFHINSTNCSLWGSVKFMLKNLSGRPEASASGVQSRDEALDPMST
jgi:hypothetical protein